jgi:hypothetical protein
MATDAEKVKMYREKAKDTTIPQEVRNSYLDRANELERKAYEATKVPEKKMAKGGAVGTNSLSVSRPNVVGGPTPAASGVGLRGSLANDMLGVKTMVVKAQPKLAKQKATKAKNTVQPIAQDYAFAKGGMPVRGSRTATNKTKKMMGGGYAMPAKTTMMSKGGAVKKAPAKKGK